jgi:hypothetical protein
MTEKLPRSSAWRIHLSIIRLPGSWVRGLAPVAVRTSSSVARPMSCFIVTVPRKRPWESITTTGS